MTILDEIIQKKYKEVEERKKIVSQSEISKQAMFKRQTLSLKESIKNTSRTGIIAEFKRKSPSKGLINGTSTVEEVTQAYSGGGASGLSVLTDFHYFGGKTSDLEAARKVNNIPILRKDFIVDDYQIFEARAMGADVILLIAASLSEKQMQNLAKCAHNLELEILMEIHTAEELQKINQYVDIVGVNNRNLKDFTVDINRSIELSQLIPNDFVKISESGISDIKNIKLLKQYGFEGFLIGENFMKTSNPGQSFLDFIAKLNE